MSENSTTLDQMTLSEKWAMLGDKDTCPVRLTPLVGSRVIDTSESFDSTVLIVELLPGMTFDGIFHLATSLASFFDLAMNSVLVADVPERARRVQVTLKTSR